MASKSTRRELGAPEPPSPDGPARQSPATRAGAPAPAAATTLDDDAAPRQYEDVLDRVSDAVVALDRHWQYTYVNKQAADLFGRRSEELIGRHIWTVFPEGVGQPFHLAYERALADQVFIQMESFYEPWDRWFENRIYPSSDGLSIFFHDITARKRAEDTARQSAALLRGQNELLEQIARGEPLPRVLDVLLRFVEAQCPGMLSSVLLLDRDHGRVRHGGAPNLPESFTRAIDGQPIGPRAGSCGTAAYRREPVIVEDIATDPLWAPYRELALAHGLRACWSTPIFDEQRDVLGTFALYFATPGRPTPSHRELIDVATRTAAIAIIKNREADALRASEERLRLALTGGNVGTWEWDLRTDRLVWSAELKAMFGWPEDFADLNLQTFRAAVHPEDQAGLTAAVERSLAQRSEYNLEFRVLRPDGSLRWIAASGRGHYSKSGRPYRMMGIAIDVTERRQHQEEIQRREAQLAEAQHIAHLGSYEWDVQTNSVRRSVELCRIFGVDPEAFPPTFEGYLERVHPDDRSTTRHTIETAFREGAPFEFEERILRSDGQIRILHSQGTWVLDSNRRPLRLLGICQDVTARRQAEEEIRRSDERFQLLARATNDAIWDCDLTTGAVWWNQGITTLFHYPPGEVGPDMGWKLDHVHPDDRDRIVSGIRGATAARAALWAAEYRFACRGGSHATVVDRAFVIYEDDGRPVRMLGAMTDITERTELLDTLEQRVSARTSELHAKNAELEHEIAQRRRVAELLRARNEELKSFAYTVSHDLKAPLRGIAGYARELERRHSAGLSERARLCLTQIQTATRNLDRLIEDLLHYSRLDAETPTPVAVDLAGLVDGILRDRKPVITEHQAEISVDLAAANAYAWERGLLQVLTNLIDNALKYSRQATPPRIHIASDSRAGMLRLTVSDNGIGFDMKYHDRIYGLFNRLVRQEEFEGTGAGLAIVKKVLDKMGGRISAQSTVGAGAAFVVELPLADQA